MQIRQTVGGQTGQKRCQLCVNGVATRSCHEQQCFRNACPKGVNALQKSDSWSNASFAVAFLVVSAFIIAFKIFFVLPLLKRAENSTITSSKDLEGKEATVTVPIGQKTIGEIIVSTGFGKMNRMALIYACSDTADILNIASGETVLIIEVRDNIAYVTPYRNAIHSPVDKTTEWNQKKYKGGK